MSALVGATAPTNAPEGLRAARAEATALWEAGRKEESLEMLRRARVELGGDSWTSFAYGTRALALGHGWAAREALHDAVDHDPSNLDALEFYIEVEAKHPGPAGALTRVLDALADALPLREGVDREALAFLIPSMKSQRIGGAIRGLDLSDDPVARLSSHLVGASPEIWDDLCATADPAVATQARLTVLLSRGTYGAANEILAETDPTTVPVRALRVAIRRELRRGRTTQAVRLLMPYRRVRPDDAWSRDKLRELTAVKPLSHYQLATKGFPFRRAAGEPAYDPDLSTSLYCLHNSLPHHSAGYATRTHGLLRGVRAEGWNVQGVTRLGYPYDMPGQDDLGDIAPRIEVDDVPYHRLSHSPGIEKKNPIQPYVERYVDALSGLARRERPFVLHAASNHWNGLSVVECGRRLGIPSVYEVRGLWEVTRGSRDPDWMSGGMFRYMARMEADAARGATRVLTITQALADELVNRGVEDDKISVVPNGVDTSRFVPRPRDEELARRLGVQGRTVVGYVGSILDYEGLDLLIDAAATLKAERSDVAFLFVGDGAELVQFRERVEAENLGDVVIFTGRVPHHEVEDYYSLVDICPFPRLPLPVCEMVSPLKPFEAMAMGKAVVASDVAALAEIVTEGENGLLHRKGDAESLTAVIRDLLEHPERRQRLGEQALAWVRRERDWGSLAGRVSELYTSLGGSATRRGS
ncbi:glycosyltransferase family 4 protein [uncultured Serinicoccus sp.]|uniref:glycosyltransferase family 4 protein n=1 Tax=uncultured Serinicoccus sp. TaxID=735514 RepID=UPI00261D1D18|nr:glycosyltransferase family 4 protein [uncultured Serinicoccus sp.]